MSDAPTQFFGTWSETDPAARRETLGTVMAPDFQYADPRSSEPVTDLDALADYVGEFSGNAPGWSATVISDDAIAGVHRVMVGFGDATGVKMHGTYFAEMDDAGLIRRLIGFKGTGAPE